MAPAPEGEVVGEHASAEDDNGEEREGFGGHLGPVLGGDGHVTTGNGGCKLKVTGRNGAC